jgi:hypothetical protein
MGMDGVGKTTAGRELARRLDAQLVSLDDYLEKKRGAYLPHLQCDDIRALIGRLDLPIIIEGVCLRAAAERCGIKIDLHIYVRRINQYGRWNDQAICLGIESPDLLKEEEQELQAEAKRLFDQDCGSVAPEQDNLGLRLKGS